MRLITDSPFCFNFKILKCSNNVEWSLSTIPFSLGEQGKILWWIILCNLRNSKNNWFENSGPLSVTTVKGIP